MDRREKAREIRGTKPFHGKIEFVFSPRTEANHQENSRQRLKLVDTPPQQNAIRFQKNKVAARREGADKMRDPWMVQRLASANPNDRSRAGDDVPDFFVRNGMIGTAMQNLRWIDKLEQTTGAPVLSPDEPSDPGFR